MLRSGKTVRKMLAGLLAVAVLGGALAGPGAAAESARPKEFKETPAQRDKRMKWWREARFGMFIHWGLYAVPAGTWKGKRVGGIGEWIMDRARIPVPEYEKLVPQFNPVKFNATQWARIAKAAGQKYMVLTSKHHDGFCLWDSKVGDYDIQATPFKRNIVKELAEACEAEGVRFGVYHSIMDWHQPDQNKNFPAYEKYLYAQVRELLTDQKLWVLWFDGEWIKQWTREKGREMEAFCHGLAPDIVINNRVGKRHREDGDYGTPEQKIPATGLGYDWETCMTMNGTWGYKSYDHNWKSTEDLLRKLVDIASKGGNFLLNVGPTAEGLIPEPSVKRLKEMGAWLAVNGESIYGTTAIPFKRLGWGRCTKKPGTLYLHVFNWPKSGELLVAGLANKVTKAYLLADKDKAPLKTSAGDGGVTVHLPAAAPDKIDTVVVLRIEGAPSVAAQVLRQAKDGSVLLAGGTADLHGAPVKFEQDKNCIGFWTHVKSWVSWDFKLDKPGEFTVELTFACEAGSGGSEYVLAVGKQKLTDTVQETGAWTTFEKKQLGRIKLDKGGTYKLTIRPKTKPNLAVMNLRSVKLLPAK